VRTIRRSPPARRTRLRFDLLEERTVPSTTVAAIQVNDGSAQRSEVRSITTVFSGPVTFAGGNANAADAFQLRSRTTESIVGLTAAVSADGAGRTVVTLTFSGPGTDPASAAAGVPLSLADGRYVLSVFANDVTDAAGHPLDGDANGTPGGNYVSPTESAGGPGLHLYRLFGDATGDGIIDLSDLTAFRNTYNTAAGNPAYRTYLDANGDGAIDLNDLTAFRTQMNQDVFAAAGPPEFYVNPATGNDANNGRTPTTAWKTWGRLVAAVNNGTITGGAWTTPDGQPAGISTIPTNDAKQAWYTAYQAGQRVLTGAHIFIDTSAAPLQVTDLLTLPPGCEIESATNDLTNLQVNVPIAATEVWAQPIPPIYPHVWGTTSTTNYKWTGLYEQVGGQWAQLLPITASNLSAALPQLEADAGSFYVDSVTNRLYTHTLAGGNPNTDGVARQYVPTWAEADYSHRVVEVTGGLAYKIGGDGGFGFDPTTGEAQGLNGIGSGEWNDISVIDSSLWTRAGKHTFSAVGNQAQGLVVFRNDTAEEGPGGVFVGYWTHFVDYTSFSGAGSAVSIYDGDKTVNGWANVDAPGGSDALPTYLALIAHSDDTTHSFGLRLIENCNFAGSLSLGGPETALAEMRDSVVAGSLVTTAAVTTIDRSKLGYAMPEFDGGSATLTDCILVPGTSYTSQPFAIQGTVVLNRCTIDLTRGVNYSTAWLRTAALNLSITNSVILGRPNAFYGLVYDALSSDSILIDHSVVQDSSGDALVRNYNNNGSTVTYANGEAGVPGVAVTNTLIVTNAGLDPTTYMPLTGSPAIGQSVPATDAPDFTGQIWHTRRTAGALEYP
jgi:hypothetical protein